MTNKLVIVRVVAIWMLGFSILPIHRSDAMFIGPSPAPLDRLIANTEQHIDKNPNDVKGHYVLARLHYLAFVRESDLIGIYRRSKAHELPSVAPFFLDPYMSESRQKRVVQERAAHLRYEAQRIALEEAGFEDMSEFNSDLKKRYEFAYTDRSSIEAEVKSKTAQRNKARERLFVKIQENLEALKQANWTPRLFSEEDLNHHVTAAHSAFNQAIELEAHHALAHHGLASLKEQYLTYLDESNVSALKEMEPLAISDLLNNYYIAHKSAFAQDKRLETKPNRGIRSLVSFEAGNAFLRNYKKLNGHTTLRQKYRAYVVRRNVKQIKQLPPSQTITPIIFSLERTAIFSDLISNNEVVEFDLSGYGRGHIWPWVTPLTSFLVYDPDNLGMVTSARQMFGNYTFEIPFDNGYQALAILDDDGNGELSGSELSGIAAWNDVNRNGISEPGEVNPVRDLGIRGIALDFRTRSDRYLGHPAGLRLENGETLPTWDWLVTPIQ